MYQLPSGISSLQFPAPALVLARTYKIFISNNIIVIHNIYNIIIHKPMQAINEYDITDANLLYNNYNEGG